MKIVILNESFLKEEHIKQLTDLGEVDIYTDTESEDQAVARLQGADAAVADCWLTPLRGSLFKRVPSLKYVSLNSTGFDLVELEAARSYGIAIANIPGFSTDGVAEHTIALLFAVVRHIPQADAAMRQAPFQVDPADTANMIYAGANLRGKTFGIIGLGQIGSRVAEIAQGLGMKVIAYNRTPRDMTQVEMVELDELFERSDVVSLNSAMSSELADVINTSALQRMKSTAYIINTARGGLINEEALAKALREGRLAGAGLDVVSTWDATNPLLSLDNVVLTPHIAYLTRESLDNMAQSIVENIKGFAEGGQRNVIN